MLYSVSWDSFGSEDQDGLKSKWTAGYIIPESSGKEMAEETRDSIEETSSPEAVEAAKRQSRLNLLILAGVFALGVILPPEYKAFAPILFLVPVIMAVVKKVRQAGEKPGDTPPRHDYAPPMHESMPSGDFYGYEPKDPKDPRRYKPIG